MTPNCPEASSNSTTRLSLGTVVVPLCAIILAIFAAITIASGPGTRLAWELVPAYTQVRQSHSVLPLLTFDAAFTDAFTMPYCGWPPLYGLLLIPFAWLGISFPIGTVILNSLLAMLAGWLAARTVRAAGFSGMEAAAFIIVALSTGIGGNLTMAFPHFLLPLPLLLTSWVCFSISQASPRESLLRLSSIGTVLGLVCGLSNWASYFNITVPAVLAATLLVPARFNLGIKSRPCIVAGLAMGVTLCICFVALLAFKEWAYSQPSALPFRTAMDSDKFLARVMGSPADYVKGCFYTVIRAAVVLVPVGGGLILAKCLGVCRMGIFPTRNLIFALALVLPAMVYALIFVGESNHPAHGFYSILWVAPAIALLAFVRTHESFRTALLLGASMIAANVVVLLGSKAVPPQVMQVSGIPIEDLTLRGPTLGSKPANAEPSAPPSGSMKRGILKQTLLFPYDFLNSTRRVRSMQEIGTDIRSEAASKDAVLIFGENHVQWDLARFAERTVVGITSGNSRSVVHFFETRSEPLDILVVVPAGTGPETHAIFDEAFTRTHFQVREVNIMK
jgi:hypothetical protein